MGHAALIQESKSNWICYLSVCIVDFLISGPLASATIGIRSMYRRLCWEIFQQGGCSEGPSCQCHQTPLSIHHMQVSNKWNTNIQLWTTFSHIEQELILSSTLIFTYIFIQKHAINVCIMYWKGKKIWWRYLLIWRTWKHLLDSCGTFEGELSNIYSTVEPLTESFHSAFPSVI